MRFIGCVWSSFLLLCIVLLPYEVQARSLSKPCYTNIAGQVIAGPIQRIDENQVVFHGRAYPLTIFPERERRRMLKAAGVKLQRPRENKRERRDLFYQNLIHRQDELERHGVISHEKAEAQRELIRKAWRRSK